MKPTFLLCVIVISALILQSCASGLTLFSERKVGGFPKPGEPQGFSRPAGDLREPKPLYEKIVSQKIEKDESYMESGSLFERKPNSSYLIEDRLPVVVGEFLTIAVVDANKNQTSEGNDPNAAQANENAPNDEDLKKIFEELPELDPGEDKSGLVTSFDVEVIEITEKGDARVAYRRRSETQVTSPHEISFSGMIDHKKLQKPETLTSQDLKQIQWFESIAGKKSHRQTMKWNNELTARLSGFTEAKSSYAIGLEEKRKRLLNVRKELSTKMAALSKERVSMAETRRKLREDREILNEKMASLEDKIKEQQEELQELKVEEGVPGDRREDSIE